jgi:hypothetical protein
MERGLGMSRNQGLPSALHRANFDSPAARPRADGRIIVSAAAPGAR